MNWMHEAARAAAWLLLVAPPAYAQAGSSSGGMDSYEATTLWSINEANHKQMETAALAKTKSRSQSVKDLSGRFLDDFRNAEAQIQAYARNRNIDLAALSRQLSKASDDEIELERRSRSLGSGTGEYAFTSEREKTNSEAQTALGKLRKLEGGEFDHAFARNMVTDHRTLMGLLTDARAQTSAPEMRSLVDKLLPDVEQHLSELQTLVSNL